MTDIRKRFSLVVTGLFIVTSFVGKYKGMRAKTIAIPNANPTKTKQHTPKIGSIVL